MDKLKIVYYMNIKTNKIVSFIEEKNEFERSRILREYFHYLATDLDSFEDKKSICHSNMLVNYYINLFRKGYSYEVMDEMLRADFLKHYDIPNHKHYLDCLLLQRKILAMAFETYTCYHLKDNRNQEKARKIRKRVPFKRRASNNN